MESYKINFDVLQADKESIKRCEEGFKKLQSATECKSLLKKYLTKDTLEKCKGRMTKNGGTFWHVIASGKSGLFCYYEQEAANSLQALLASIGPIGFERPLKFTFSFFL